MQLLLKTIEATRAAVGPDFPIAVKLNSSDQLEVVAAQDQSSVDLVDISGGTYFPGAEPASEGAGRGAYFIEFAKRARASTTKPLMLTGGFKTRMQAEDVVASGIVDIVGLARMPVLEPTLPDLWKEGQRPEPLSQIHPQRAELPLGIRYG